MYLAWQPAWIDGATHNNLETVHSVAYMRAFRAFLQHLLSTRKCSTQLVASPRVALPASRTPAYGLAAGVNAEPNTPEPKAKNFWDFLMPKPSTPTTTVEPNVPAS